MKPWGRAQTGRAESLPPRTLAAARYRDAAWGLNWPTYSQKPGPRAGAGAQSCPHDTRRPPPPSRMFPPPSALLGGRQQDTKGGVGDSSGGFQSRACWGLQGGRRGGLRQGPLQAQMTQLPLGAGYRVKEACGELTGTVCAPCDPGTYTAHLNGLSECLQCRVCDPGRTPGHSHHPTGDPRPAAVGSHRAGTAVPHPTSSAGQASAREPFRDVRLRPHLPPQGASTVIAPCLMHCPECGEPITLNPSRGPPSHGSRPASPDSLVLGDWTVLALSVHTRTAAPPLRGPACGSAFGPLSSSCQVGWGGGAPGGKAGSSRSLSAFGSSRGREGQGLGAPAHPQILDVPKEPPVLWG